MPHSAKLAVRHCFFKSRFGAEMEPLALTRTGFVRLVRPCEKPPPVAESHIGEWYVGADREYLGFGQVPTTSYGDGPVGLAPGVD